MTKTKKILAINFGGIGDEILFFPVLKTLKEINKDCHITLVVEPRSQSCKDLTDTIDEVITCDIKSGNKYFEVLKFLSKIRKENYDVVISSGGSTFVSILLFLTGIKECYGYDSGSLSKSLLTQTVELNKNQYAACMYHDLIKPLDEKAQCSIPEVKVEPDNLRFAAEKIGSREKQVVLVHPGVSKMSIAKNIMKFWKPQNWSKLIVQLLETGKYKVILAGGPDDEKVIQQIRAEIELSDVDKNDIIDTFGQTKNIQQLAGLIKLSDITVCVDSAPMHIAIGVGTKTVALFGPTNENKLVPQGYKKIQVITNENAVCRPCLWDKRSESCKAKRCLRIESERVFNAIERMLG